MKSIVDQDKYGIVVNSAHTYRGIATFMSAEGKLIFAWTDGHGTQLDILMVYLPLQAGTLQRGMNSVTDLFVAVSLGGMFGFKINRSGELFPSYVGEKLGLGGHNETTAELAGLINGVIKELTK